MNDNDKKRYLNKIKKLFALAAKTTNSNEAGNAMRQAQNLMRVMNISQSEAASINVDETQAKPKLSQKPTSYIANLIALISQAFGVKALYIKKMNGSSVRFFGVDGRSEIAAYVFEVLFRQLVKARKDFQLTQNKNLKRINLIARSDQFCTGWVQGVESVITAFEVPESENEMITEYLSYKFKNINELTPRELKNVHGAFEAKNKGYFQGRKVQLNRGMKGQGQYKIEVH